MKILVTGGAGYIGSIATEVLIDNGYDVVVVDDLSKGHRQAVHPSAEFVKLDLADSSRLGDVFRQHQPEAVMHFAARTLVGESVEAPFMYLRQNVGNGINLLQAAVENGVKYFILSSTAAVFDQPDTVPIPETEPINPGSPYGETKFFMERMLHWLNYTHGLRFAVLRYFNAAGATETRGEDHTPESHLIPLVLQVALGQRASIKIFGDDYPTPDGTCLRDYVHVRDLTMAHVLALEALRSGKEKLTYHLGYGEGYSVKDIIETARRVTGHPIPAETAPRRAGDPPILIADSRKIRAELGWKPQFANLETIVRTAWNWHQSHPNGYGD